MEKSKCALGIMEKSKCALGIMEKSKCALGIMEKSKCALGIMEKSKCALGIMEKSKCALGITEKSKDALGITEKSKDALGIMDKSKCALGIMDKSKCALGIMEKSKDALGIMEKSECALGIMDKSKDALGIVEKSKCAQGIMEKSKYALGIMEKSKCALGIMEKSKCALGIMEKSKCALGIMEKSKCALGIMEKKSNVRFTAWLKEERNCWAMLVEEMRAGKLVAESTKDFTAITQAMQNVLLVDAIVRSGTDENTAHHHKLSQSADSLCYFTAYIAENRHELPKDTSQALQHRVDPNSGQRERKTVEVLLYVSGSTQSTENSVPPRLWCGMGDGKVRILDATNWTLEKTFVQTKSTVACLLAVGETQACLLAVGETQVWAGSQGIFIIDTATISCNKTLMEHQDLVSDMALSSDGWYVYSASVDGSVVKYVYSASVDGSIVKWEVQTLTVMCNFCLDHQCFIRSLHLHDNQLWCGTWESILVVDLDGNHLQTFQYQPVETSTSTRPEQLDCFVIVREEVWAGCRRSGTMVVWDINTVKVKCTHKLDCRGISIMRVIDDKIWVGTKDGTIFIYRTQTGRLWKTIKAHEDAVRALCAAESRYVMSGAGSKDGKVAIWSPQATSLEMSVGSRADE
ncbi:hypothetical protein ACOMHN_039400 [Nucella lapillus]